MSIRVVLFDVGGVLLSNGWDHVARGRAVDRFGLDKEEFERRHQELVDDLETDRIGIEEYLDQAVFHRRRSFTREDFLTFMRGESKPHDVSLRAAADLAKRGGHVLGTLNNESLYLNRHRIDTFGLREIFGAFFSSCHLGVAKPHEEIYERALRILQVDGADCLFLDDREENVEGAMSVGLRAVRVPDPAAVPGLLREQL